MKNNILYYSKYIFAIIFYLIVFNLFTDILIVPLLKNILKIDTLSFLINNYTNPYSILFKIYPSFINYANTLLQLIIYGILFIGLYLILKEDINEDIIDFNKDGKNQLKYIGIALLIYYALSYLTILITFIAKKYLGYNDISFNQANIESLMTSSFGSSIIMTITTVLLGPLVEELVFRKAMFKIIKIDILAIIISSLLFGFLHTYSYDYNFIDLIFTTLPYFVSGIAFGFLYYKSKNIFSCYLLHAGLNLLSVIAIFR